MKNKLLLILFTYLTGFQFAQNQHPKFKELLTKSTTSQNFTTFCVKDDKGVIDFLNKEKIEIKYRTDSWLFISATPHWLNDAQNRGFIKQFYFETAPATLLNDTSRLQRYVDPVHNGSDGLKQPYTGKNVVLGFIDDGFELNHPDFKDSNGRTRVLRLWDQSVNPSGHIYTKYKYGRLWDSTEINNGLCTQKAKQHGTLIAGAGAGNGLANGKNRGMAPDAKIVLVTNSVNLPNWSLTIADACDFIFKFADSLGLPAVINISSGNYYGSHDGNDPGTILMEKLLDEKPGRLIVAAAGNSGLYLPFHVTGNVTNDTSFVWFNNDATGGNVNKVKFDLWADTSDANFNYAFGADKPAPNYGFRGRTNFRKAKESLNKVISDTIWNGSNRIATLQVWTEIIDSAYHMQLMLNNLDSTTYLVRFMTTGFGKYDLWSGKELGSNSIVSTLPSSSLVPEIIHYQSPDSLQTMVSGFQCSEKVITVGNIRGRFQYIDKNGNTSTMTPNSPGKISPSSSAGPTRTGFQKPDISMNGDGVLSTSVITFLNNSANNSKIAQAGWHSVGGGTSQASPGMAGIAALYFEKCPSSTYSDFKKDLFATASKTPYTGVTPNYRYGYGQPHALNLLLGNSTIPIVGESIICKDSVNLSVDNSYSVVDSIVWSTGIKSTTIRTDSAGNYKASIYYGKGCQANSYSFLIKQGQILSNPIITENNGTLFCDKQPNYQWFLNDTILPNDTSQILSISSPIGEYYCSTKSGDGCFSESNKIKIAAGLGDNYPSKFAIFPNPTSNEFTISISEPVLKIQAIDMNGKIINLEKKSNQTYSILTLEKGLYFLRIETNKGLFHSKVIKM